MEFFVCLFCFLFFAGTDIGVTQLASLSVDIYTGVYHLGHRRVYPPGEDSQAGGRLRGFLFYYILGEWARARANTFLDKKALDQAGSRSDWHGYVFRLEGSSLHAHLVGI